MMPSGQNAPAPGKARPVFLSVIIPAHNEARRLPPTIAAILEFLRAQPYHSEVLVVENGSRDDTFALAQAMAREEPGLRVLREKERGKGLAVRRGMLEARGEYRLFSDADLSVPVNEISRFLPPLLTDFDVAIASRELPGSVRIAEPAWRHLVGRAFNAMIRVMVLPGFQDTQCGFKCFRAAPAEDIFLRQRLSGMAFDAEVIYIARRRGYRIKEVPAPWRFNPDSRVRLVRDSMEMGCDLARIRRNGRRGLYDRESRGGTARG
jgi:glycosyltransferase involved in cell wall biosynthesis